MRRGFTLLEVMVALVVLAVAMGALVRAAGASAGTSGRLGEHLQAAWVAADRLTELRVGGAWPAPGTSDGSGEEGGQTFYWRQEVRTTDNPLVRTVVVTVFDDPARRAPVLSRQGWLVRLAP